MTITNPFDVPRHGPLGRPTRPPRQGAPALPPRQKIAEYHDSPLLAAFTAMPGLGARGPDARLNPIDEILLSLAWNQPGLDEVPVLGASVGTVPGSGDARGRREATVEQQGPAVDQFLHQGASIEAMVMPSEEAHARNLSSLYKAAVHAGLRKSMRGS